VLWSTGASELTVPKTDGERQVANVSTKMAIAAGVPRPRILDHSGRRSQRIPRPATTCGDAHIAVTRGLLTLCNRYEHSRP